MSNASSEPPSSDQVPDHVKATAPASHQPPAPKRFWSPGSAITIAVVLFVAAQIIGGLVISVYPLLRHWSDDRTNAWINGAYVQFVYVVLAEGLTVAGLLWFMGKRRITLRALGWNRFRAMYIAYALLGFGVYFVAYLILLSAASALIPASTSISSRISASAKWQASRSSA
ncbi:MAG: hypothetical protein WDN27_03525 [Candidatus Saccharibacteria bacterium]